MPELIRRLAALLNLLLAGALFYLGARIGLRTNPSALVLLLVGAFAGLGILALFAARGLWRGTLLGAFLSLVVQGTQLVQGESHPLTYVASLPVSLVVGVTAEWAPHVEAHGRPALEITPDDDPSLTWVGLNLPALLVVGVAGALLIRRPPRSPTPAPATP